jgi:hypothetical protein
MLKWRVGGRVRVLDIKKFSIQIVTFSMLGCDLRGTSVPAWPRMFLLVSGGKTRQEFRSLGETSPLSSRRHQP